MLVHVTRNTTWIHNNIQPCADLNDLSSYQVAIILQVDNSEVRLYRCIQVYTGIIVIHNVTDVTATLFNGHFHMEYRLLSYHCDSVVVIIFH